MQLIVQIPAVISVTRISPTQELMSIFCEFIGTRVIPHGIVHVHKSHCYNNLSLYF